MEMKIAIPTRDNTVDNHFGHCAEYTIFTADENGKVLKKETVPSPQGCGCKSNIASVLQQMGVKVMLAGSMGAGALNVLQNHGIDVYRGCSGATEDIVKSYLSGGITDSGEGCKAHDNDHRCSHEN